MSLRVGDELLFDGALGRIVAVTDTTDENGRGSIAYGGQTFRFRVLKATGPDVPLVATSDLHFRVGLLQRKDAPEWFCLVCDDLPAPSGWGRWIQQDRWREASELEAQDSVVFVLGWRPGEITVRIGGQVQAGVFADIVLRYQTHEGAHEAWYQPAYPYNDLQVDINGVPLRGPNKLGCFKTDANGILHRHDPDGTLEPIILPRGFAALAQREQDTWASAPTPERVLTRAEVWFQQEHAEIAEGQAATLDVAAVEITVNGVPGAFCVLLWEGGIPRPSDWNAHLTLDGSGQAVASGLPPGRYTAAQYHPSDKSKGSARAGVDALTSGGSYEINLPTSWTTVSSGYIQGIVYADADTGAAGAVIYAWKTGLPGHFEAIATCDANGAYGPVEIPVWSGDDFFAYHPDYGAVGCFDSAPTKAIWFDPQLAGPFGAVVSASTEFFPEGLCPWGVAGRHENLVPAERVGYMLDEDSGVKYWFREASGGCGIVTDSCPRAKWSPPLGAGTWEPRSYSLCEADGTVLQSGLGVGSSLLPPWADIREPYRSTTTGSAVSGDFGGKIEGNLVEADRTQEITADNLPEAFRMGLEFGAWRQPLEARTLLPLSAARTLPPLSGTERGSGGEALTFQAWECPYCGGPAWAGPDAEGYQRGFCMQCADFGIETDCRTYFITRALAAVDDWQTRWVRNTTSGAHADRLIQGWPRPEEYDETDDYLVWDWQDLGIPRWVAVHLQLGAWNSGTFVDGESILEAETRLGRTIGPVMLKFELTEDYQGTGQTLRIHCTRPDGQSETRTVTVPPGSRAGDLFPLAWRPHHCYPQGYTTDVTGIEKLAGDGAVFGRVVNDGPAWHSTQGVQVLRATHSPYACDVAFGGRDPFLVEDFAGRLHLAYLRDGQVMHRVLEGTSAIWSDPANITALANWPHPCEEPSLAPLPHAELLAAAHTNGATRLWRTRDDGERWE